MEKCGSFSFRNQWFAGESQRSSQFHGSNHFSRDPMFFGCTRLNVFDGEDVDSTLLSEYVMQRCRCHKPVGCQVLSVLSLISLPGSSLFVIR